MENSNEMTPNTKQRHGCVTTWLVLMIIGNSVSAIMYLFANDIITQNLPSEVSNSMMIVLAVLGIGNVVFSVMLFNWNKLGFWGFILTSICALIVNLSIGLGIAQSLFGLAGVAILYGVLQIKKDNVTAWDNLE
jgi:hypothetical protein